jgi:hypothetical protein
MGKLKIGDKVRIINSKKLVSIHNEKFIGQESEIYNIINNFVGVQPKYILKDIPLEWDESSLEVIESISIIDSQLKYADNNIEKIERQLQKLNHEKTRFEKMKDELMKAKE